MHISHFSKNKNKKVHIFSVEKVLAQQAAILVTQ